MDETKARMQLSPQQRRAVIHLDDHGVRDLAPLFVMDFETWQMYRPENFFDYFAPKGTVASYARFKPVWQRYSLLHTMEARVLQGIFDRLDGNYKMVLDNKDLSHRYYRAYVKMSSLVDELDSLVDRDLQSWGFWNHGYVINDKIDNSDS
ncbi:MAG: hypothetical protein GY759_03200 [Chloroflexi bacterium]|nr:hypothetical protein [Chloroflexota bacterium]